LCQKEKKSCRHKIDSTFNSLHQVPRNKSCDKPTKLFFENKKKQEKKKIPTYFASKCLKRRGKKKQDEKFREIFSNDRKRDGSS